jgi:1-phosphofructokinase family hexose kinase
MRLLVVCPNLALDRILEVDGFRPATVQRSRAAFSQPGGKGANVARVFRQLGGDVVLTGFVGRSDPWCIVQPLSALAIQVDVIEAYPGESRRCTIILDAHGFMHPTVINEESPEIDDGSADRLMERFERNRPSVQAVLVTGSLSRGLPPDFYRKIIERSKSESVFTCIDATGPVLRHGLDAMPDLVKTNAGELSSVLGKLGEAPQEIARSLIRRRNELPAQTVVTLGEAGALLLDGEEVYHATSPRISHVNPIGAGDAFAAGYIKAHFDGKTPPQALAFATAAAASDAATAEPGLILSSELATLVAATVVTKW